MRPAKKTKIGLGGFERVQTFVRIQRACRRKSWAKLGEEFTTNKVSPFRSAFVATVTCAQVRMMLYKDAKDVKGSYAERTCYDCWAFEDGSPTREGFLQAQKCTSKWVYTCLLDPSVYDDKSCLLQFVAEDNEKEDGPAQGGAMLTGSDWCRPQFGRTERR